MRFVIKYAFNWQGGFGPFAGLLFILLTALIPSHVCAAQDNTVKILYFFSPSCKHCNEAKPFIINLSKVFSMEGLRFGEGDTPSFPFPVKQGDKSIAEGTYDVKGVPTLAILIDGVYRQKISGMPDIQDALVIVKGLKNGAMTITEATQTLKNGEITITGWIIARGIDFKKAQFFITDRKTELSVKAWLPREVVKSPVQKKRPRFMSDVIKKPVILKGIIKRNNSENIFFVTQEVLLD
ncbi:MAG TPA: hypothetical protein VLX29_09590 [Nitrospirota bacterium]|nr:hypothetical protein [Nitrospirota bacterium]